ncbi:Hypothetical protein I595_2798 [Croceitalea dokdonensis DOKDO 023]|uniref:Uncharacterized protein n=1 Tax=Croceitalea dokdonensis DOKDO 023 TaxID=1300341 RepID=A0A0P7A2Y2_9FLAO|nr:Hypothetical protein I595_2798 [Croceitalea dokdonensis DOKDO 023]
MHLKRSGNVMNPSWDLNPNQENQKLTKDPETKKTLSLEHPCNYSLVFHYFREIKELENEKNHPVFDRGNFYRLSNQ